MSVSHVILPQSYNIILQLPNFLRKIYTKFFKSPYTRRLGTKTKGGRLPPSFVNGDQKVPPENLQKFYLSTFLARISPLAMVATRMATCPAAGFSVLTPCKV